MLGRPEEPKYRRVRLSNPKARQRHIAAPAPARGTLSAAQPPPPWSQVSAALAPHPAARQLLELAGFAAAADGEHLEMADAAARDAARLQLALAVLKAVKA